LHIEPLSGGKRELRVKREKRAEGEKTPATRCGMEE
jgi:hypothetical protein